MKDNAASVAHNPEASTGESREALTQLHKGALAGIDDRQLIPAERLAPLLEFIANQSEEQAMEKALRANNVVQFPSYAAREKKPGMQSVYLDDVQVGVMGEYYERPGAFTFDAMRQMVEATPILNAVIMTRIRQVQRFCKPNVEGRGPGFQIRMRDKSAQVGGDVKDSLGLLQKFFCNGGMEFKPRERRRLKRDDMGSFMAKIVRDSLEMDAAAIETEFKRDRSRGIDGIYAVDGSTIRLCTEQGYEGRDEIFALQIVQGNIRSAYTYDDLVYVPRNPRTNVMAGGYGLAETELLIRTVTGFLNAFTYNVKFFDSNAMPRGVLNLYGSYDDKDIAAFKRYWNGMVKGINNAWAMPVMVSKDQESAAKFESFGEQASELMFGKWMTFLASIICAIYGMAPDEINFESFTNGTSSLSGSDTEEKIASSKDKGLRPLLSYFEGIFTDYIVSDFNEDAEFHWTGLDEEDAQTVWDRKKMTMTVNEVRAEDGLEPIAQTWGEAPLNPSLIAPWQQEAMPQQEDYGQPGQTDPGADGGQDGNDFGQADQELAGAEGGQADGNDFGQVDEQGGAPGGDQGGDEPLGKSFGLPVFRIEA